MAVRVALALFPLLLLLAACGAPPEPVIEEAPVAPSPPLEMRRGLWVLAEGSERPLESDEGVRLLLEQARELRATDLFVQVYRSGRSWYPGTIADDTPFRDRVGKQRLVQFVADAHAAGLRVHAWWNALALHRNRRAPILEALGRDAVLVDRSGRSLLDYPGFDVPPPDRAHTRLGTPGIWLDPAVPGVAEWLADAVAELVAVLPELDGIHLDFIRYPLALPIVPGSRFDGLDFGYGAPVRQRFERETGRSFRRGDAFDQFRRDSLADLVERLGQRLPASWERSAAVIAYADRAYLSAFQDWRSWLERGLLDFAVAMAYTRDDVLLRQIAQGLRGGVGGDHVWIGVGSWLFAQEPTRLAGQLAIARAAQPAGIVLFSWDALARAPEARAAVRWTEAESP